MRAPLGGLVTEGAGGATVAVAGLTLTAFAGLVGPIHTGGRDPAGQRAGVALSFAIAFGAGLLSWAATDSLLPGVVGVGLAYGLASAYAHAARPVTP